MTLLGANAPDQSGPGNQSNEEILQIPQISKAGASLSGGLMSYLGHSFLGSYSSTDMQSLNSTAPAVYSTAPTDRAPIFESNICFEIIRIKYHITVRKENLCICSKTHKRAMYVNPNVLDIK